MNLSDVIGSAAIAIAIGIALGLGFKFATGDSKIRSARDIGLGILFSGAGWLFAMMLPIREYKAWGADLLAVVSGFIFLHIYWAAIKEKSNLSKGVDSESPHHRTGERDLPHNI